MPYDKVVDSSALDAGLTKIADAVRDTTGETGKMSFPDGVVERLNNFDRIAQLQKMCLDVAKKHGWTVEKIPAGTTVIERDVYYGNYKSDNVYLEMPDTIEKIEDWGFGLCKQFCPHKLSDALTSVEAGAFYGCVNLGVDKLPDGLTTIGDQAFQYCTHLAITELPKSLTTIGDYAFHLCTSIAIEEIPDSVTSIGNDAFQYCSNMRLTKLSENCPVLPQNLFYYCYRGVSVTHIPACVTTIGDQAFRNCTGMAYKTLYFDGTPTSIHARVFDGTLLSKICVPWAEGEVANAPWGASYATIVYNYTGE